LSNWTEVKLVQKIAFDQPVVLIQGLPGLGFVGKITVDYLIEELKATRFAELSSSFLTMPDGSVGIQINSDGTYVLPRLDFYAYTSSNPNLIFLTGETQPASFGQYLVANSALDFAQQFSCSRILAIGGFQTLNEQDLGKVYGVLSDQKLTDELNKCDVIVTKGGAITGACGMILGLGHLRSIDCIGLLGATRGEYPDMAAAKSVIQIVTKMFGLQVSLSRIDSEINEMRSKMESLRNVQSEALRQGKKDIEKSQFYV